MVWDLFCRVIDNHGDVGVCWRLACELARRGVSVRLWIDDATALAWMAPQGCAGVQVLPWPDTEGSTELRAGEVVIEAFGCRLPDFFVTQMARQSRQPQAAPVWINLEYLSAEPYVERCHGLLSPQFSGPGAGLQKWFFYPGFTERTGGLMHAGAEDIVTQTGNQTGAQAALTWARSRGWAGQDGERAVTLFCYANPALPALLAALAGPPTVLRVPPGPVQAQLATLSLPVNMRVLPLPYMRQGEFDLLLASADLNIVRGEDSFVRAQLCSDQPLLWQAYPQHDQAHVAKLEAFLAHYLAGWPAAVAASAGALFRAFNGATPAQARPPAGAPWALPEVPVWAACHARWRQGLLAQPDLCSQLQSFVQRKRREQSGQKPG